jgi:hypothetical protein
MSMVDDMLMCDADLTKRKRISDIQRRWDAYYGSMKKPLHVGKDKIDDNVILSLTGAIVDYDASFLFSISAL